MSGTVLSAGDTPADKTRSNTRFCGTCSPVDEADMNQIITSFADTADTPAPCL